jgi:hypothetical protein
MTLIQALFWNAGSLQGMQKGKVQEEHVLKAITKAPAGGG